MSLLQLPPCPTSLKSIQHYLKTAAEHETRDPVITYWCRLYSFQTALKIDKKSDEAKNLLIILIGWLEKQKEALSDNEAVTNDIVAQAHIENYALKLFIWADGQDRAGVFNKNVVKAFYTAGMVMDILSIFGEQSEDIVNNCKYAKWKAAYIHNCLKNGETPVPGPVSWQDEEENASGNDEGNSNMRDQTNIGFNIPGPSGYEPNQDWTPGRGLNINPTVDEPSLPSPVHVPPTVVPSFTDHPPQITPSEKQDFNAGGMNYAKLEPAQITKAQKYCKFAASALTYDDIPEAINNLQKALKLLQTGQEN